MSTHVAQGSETTVLDHEDQKRLVAEAIDKIGIQPKRVLLLPPDITRLNSGAGGLTAILYEMLGDTAHVDIMPTLGTHVPMTPDELRHMFGETIPLDRFKVHEWREGLDHLGDVPGELVKEWSEGRVDYAIRIEIDRILTQGGYDLILSIGQIVPHEVVGMANYTKNICVGIGGADTINKSHFLGAVYGMERMMGRIDTPVRRVFNYGCDHYLADSPIQYILTVMEKNHDAGAMEMRGLYVGGDMATFTLGAKLSQRVNLDLLDKPLDKAVVFLDPDEFRTTWLGNKAVYRTRMAMADDGELIVLAPGLREFGEDKQIDALIRKYGYRGTPATLDAVESNEDIRANLSAAAHLIHASSEGRFRITYCPGPGVSHDEIRSVGFEAADLDEMVERYNPAIMRDGLNAMSDGEEVFYISNPALGLWGLKSQFES